MSLQLYGAARSRASMVRWYLEEKQIPYRWVSLDLAAGEQRQEAFLAINRFGKVPALVDASLSGPDGGPLTLSESGAILLHLAECHVGEFDASDPRIAAARRSLTAQWLLFCNASLGPAMLQAGSKPEELARLLQGVDDQLAGGGVLLAARGPETEGPEAEGPAPWGPASWGAADCALQAYLAYLPLFCPQLDLSPWPAVQAAIAATRERPAYQRAMGAR